MAYTRLHWVESTTPLSADNMNNIEDGIEELQSQKVDKVSGKGLSTNDYTDAEKSKLAGIETGAQVNPGNATTSAAGLMSAADKSKLNGVATGAEVNQNAYSNVIVGSSTLSADSKTDTLTIVAGNNVTLTSNKNPDSVTISAKDTTYGNASTAAAGLMSAADKTKLNGIEAGAQVNPGEATTSAAGLMSAADKTKLNGVDAHANNYTLSKMTGLASLNGSVTINAGATATLTFNVNADVLTGVSFANTSGSEVNGLAIIGWSVNNGNITVNVRNVMSTSYSLGSNTKVRYLKLS